MIRGVLLDIDGTLLDSNAAHAAAWVAALREHGVACDPARVRRLIGMGSDKLLPAVGIDASSARGRSASARHTALFIHEHLPRLRPTPGARALVERMKGEKLTRVVATSAKGDELRALLYAANIADLVEDAATSDDASASKPDPDIVHAALGRSGLPREEVLLLGDTPYDVDAGRQAKVGVVAVRCGGWDDGALAGAMRVYESPLDLLARWEGSPFAHSVPAASFGG